MKNKKERTEFIEKVINSQPIITTSFDPTVYDPTLRMSTFDLAYDIKGVIDGATWTKRELVIDKDEIEKQTREKVCQEIESVLASYEKFGQNASHKQIRWALKNIVNRGNDYHCNDTKEGKC